jgi:tRNA A37 N6-isopentenylltransferase MiaA
MEATVAETQTEIMQRAMRNKQQSRRERPPVEQARVRMTPDGRMTRADAAKYLGKSGKTLAEWHTKGKGPPSILVGGTRFYYKADLDEFIAGGQGP